MMISRYEQVLTHPQERSICVFWNCVKSKDKKIYKEDNAESNALAECDTHLKLELVDESEDDVN